MAGHNKWSKVKHTKGAIDAKRGKLFSKLSMEICHAARLGGGDVHLNSRLRQAVQCARVQNMPGETIERAIKKGTGSLEGAHYEEITYEAYAPGGVAMLIEILTDNRNRSAADIRLILSKNSGSLADTGSVSYLFARKGKIKVPGKAMSADEAFEQGVEAGAEAIESSQDTHQFTTAPDQLDRVATKMREMGIEPASEELVYQAHENVTIHEGEAARRVRRLLDILEDYEDTRGVFTNFEIPKTAQA
jgi:YebC/PmpR family DNA-binding regulatory protein